MEGDANKCVCENKFLV